MAKLPFVNRGDQVTASLQNVLIGGHNSNIVLQGDGRYIEVTNLATGKVIRWVGPPIVPNPLIIVTLAQTGGSQGTATAANTYTYTVTGTLNGLEYATGFNPATAPSLWRRSFGQVTAATAGLAYLLEGDLIMTWTNEVPTSEECTT